MGLTREEKLAKKMEKRLEKKRLADEVKKVRKRDQLQREIDAHLLWQNQVNQNFRDATLKIKLPTYRQQIEVLWHTFDRASDKRDALHNHLIYLRDLANFQYQRTIGSYCTAAEKIITNFLTDLEEMCQLNRIRTADLLQFGRDELAHYLEGHKEAETHLYLLLYTCHNAADSLAWNTSGDNVVRRNEDKATFNEIRDTLAADLENKYSWLWEEYKATLKSYVSKTVDNQKQLRLMRKKEKMMADLIAAQARKLIVSERIIKRLRIELLEYESGQKQAGYRDRRKRHRDACNRLKKSMNQGVIKDTKQLSILVKASDDPIEWFEGAYKKSEKILRVAALCRKYETRFEKILPYGMKTLPGTVKTNIRIRPEDDPMIYDTLTSTCGLARLWHRISNVELSKRALIREKMLLERENAALEDTLNEQDKENEGPKAYECLCDKPPLRKPQNPPYAIEGALEMKKYFVR